MDTSQVPAGSIVVGIDGSSWSDAALDWAIDQATLEHRALTIVHAIPSTGAQSMGLYAQSGLDFVRLLDEAQASAQGLLDAAVARAVDRTAGLVVRDVMSVSDPRTILLELGEHAAMVVVGSRGRGPIASLLLGSVSVSVSKHAACPVVVIRPNATEYGLGILLGVDGTERSVAATEFAFHMAAVRALPLTVLHADLSALSIHALAPVAAESDQSEQRALVSESLAGLGEKFPEVHVSVHLVSGFADHQLIRLSPGYDLVVIGHHQVNPLADVVYGSVAPTVLEHADGVVAVVPSHPVTSPSLSGA